MLTTLLVTGLSNLTKGVTLDSIVDSVLLLQWLKVFLFTVELLACSYLG